jgi:hypothetical protein
MSWDQVNALREWFEPLDHCRVPPGATCLERIFFFTPTLTDPKRQGS